MAREELGGQREQGVKSIKSTKKVQLKEWDAELSMRVWKTRVQDQSDTSLYPHSLLFSQSLSGAFKCFLKLQTEWGEKRCGSVNSAVLQWHTS